MKKVALLSAALAVFGLAFAVENEADWEWIDAKEVPVEGRPFADAVEYWNRLPADAAGNFIPRVQRLARDTAGMCLRFRTDSDRVRVRWSLLDGECLGFENMSANAVSGISVYLEDDRFTPAWYHRAVGFARHQDWNETIFWTNGKDRTVLVYLPLLNHPTMLQVGVKKGSRILPVPPHATGVTKPVVFYGGSTTQGVGASHAGMAWVNVVGRLLDVPVVSMGFNGNGKCEPGMAEVLARTDASAIVLQAFANMYEGEEKDCAKFEAFVREVRAKAPETPIVLLEYMYPLESRSYKHAFVPKLYEKLKAEDWKGVWAKLDIVRAKDTFAADSDMTSDGGHLNDCGQRQLAFAVSRVLGPRLGVPVAGEEVRACVPTMRPDRQWWPLARHAEILKRLETEKNRDYELVLVGDSITHRWENPVNGLAVYHQLTNRYNVLNLGSGGDRTQHVLWRLDHGALGQDYPYTAKVFAVLIGVNNTDDSPADVAAGVKAILGRIRQAHPESKILLLPIFPWGEEPLKDARVNGVNKIIRTFADGRDVILLDFGAKFLDEAGHIRPGLMMPDNLHPIKAGYELWLEAMSPVLDGLLGRK